MKKILYILALIIITLPVYANKKIIVGIDQNYPPYEFINDSGKPDGFNVQLLEQIARNKKYDLVFTYGNWDDITKRFYNGEIDLLGGMFYSEERDKKILFSDPHTIVQYTTFMRTDDSSPLNNIRQSEIIVHHGDIVNTYLHEQNFKYNLIEVASPEDGIKMLSSGHYDLMITSKILGNYILKKNNITNVHPHDLLNISFKYCFAIQPGNSELRSDINDGLAKSKRSGFYNYIYEKWFNESAKIDWRATIKYFLYFLFPIALIIIVLISWSWVLQRQVRVKTKALSQELDAHKKAEIALKESEQIFKVMFDQSFHFIALLDIEGKIIKINETTLKILNLQEHQLKGKFIWQTKICGNNPEQMDRVKFLLERVSKGEIVNYENPFIDDDGKINMLDISIKPVNNESKHVKLFIIEGRDITERTEAEKKLKRSEDFYRSIIELAADTIMVGDQNGIIVDCNSQTENLTGYERRDITGNNIDLLFTRYELERAPLRFDLLNSGKIVTTTRDLTRKDGRNIPVEMKSTMMPDGYYQTIVRDISDRLSTEQEIREKNDELEATNEELQAAMEEIAASNQEFEAINEELTRTNQSLTESEEKYRMLFTQSPAGIFIYNLNLKIIDCNQQFVDIIGSSRSKLVGLHLEEINDKRILPSLKMALKGQDGLYIGEYNATTSSKNIFVQMKPISLRDGLGNIIGGYVLVEDITEKRITESSLRDSEEKFRLLSESAPVGIFLTDDNGKLLFKNKCCYDIFIFNKQPEIEHDILDYIHPDDIERFSDKWKKIFTENYVLAEEFRIYSGDHKLKYVYATAAPLYSETNRLLGVVGTFEDITTRVMAQIENTKLEERLVRLEKMEAVGRLAGGVAHDLNNILTGIVSYPDLIITQMPPDSPLIKHLELIKQSGERAAAIIQDLLTLSRRGVISKEVTNINLVIEKYLASPEYYKLLSIHDNCRISYLPDMKLLNILCSEYNIFKLVMNLISNGMEAMESGGSLQISTRNQYIDKPISGYDRVEEGDYVVLSIKDEGIGIAKEELKRIFEPFFSKKIMNKNSGTGLGMSVVWGIVQDHGGYIDIKSEIGKGTTFEIFIPVYHGEISANDLGDNLKDYTGDGETILIIDDSEEQRRLSSEILMTLNYTPVSVSSGEEGIEYFINNPAPDLLLLDMIMEPGIDGLETYKEISRKNPGQRTIIVSGFTETERVIEAQKLGAGQYLPKPYTIAKLGRAVKNALHVNRSRSGT